MREEDERKGVTEDVTEDVTEGVTEVVTVDETEGVTEDKTVYVTDDSKLQTEEFESEPYLLDVDVVAELIVGKQIRGLGL